MDDADGQEIQQSQIQHGLDDSEAGHGPPSSRSPFQSIQRSLHGLSHAASIRLSQWRDAVRRCAAGTSHPQGHGMDLRRIVATAFAVVFVAGQLWPGGVDTGVSDTLAHFFAYLLFSLLVGWTVQDRPGFWAVIVGIAVASVLEGLQGFVPGRTPDLQDLAVDWVGVMVGAMGWVVNGNPTRRPGD